jgi:hypothetical protein
MGIFKDITTEICKQRLRELLSLFVGRGKKFTRDEFAAVTGIGRDTVDKYLTGESMPCVAKWLQMVKAVDEPVFVNGMIDLAGFNAAARSDEEEAINTVGMRAANDALGFAACITKNRIDGIVTPQEELEEARKAECAAAVLTNYSKNVRRKHGG